MTSPLRPLPTPTSAGGGRNQLFGPLAADMHESSPYLPFTPTGPRPSQVDVRDEPPTTTLPGGTLLHQGFYDLLAMIPTPSPSRLLWGASWNQQAVVAGPRYEDLSPRTDVGANIPPPPLPTSRFPKKGRRISKDMVSKPTGFMCVYRSLFVLSLTLLPVTLFTLQMQTRQKRY